MPENIDAEKTGKGQKAIGLLAQNSGSADQINVIGTFHELAKPAEITNPEATQPAKQLNQPN